MSRTDSFKTKNAKQQLVDDSRRMRIGVIGAGIIGSVFAARLADAGHEVCLLARGERLATLARE